MSEILVSHPLIILYLVYVLGVLLAAFWPDLRRPTREERGVTSEEGSATGESSAQSRSFPRDRETPSRGFRRGGRP
jgi:hypothetical protein